MKSNCVGVMMMEDGELLTIGARDNNSFYIRTSVGFTEMVEKTLEDCIMREKSRV